MDDGCIESGVIGQIGEYYARILFLSNGFDVYMPLIDNKGIDFIAKRNEKEYKVQVKTVCPYSYCYIRDNDNNEFNVEDGNFLVCYIRLKESETDKEQLPVPDILIFNATLWGSLSKNEKLKDILVDYSQRKNNPEYGIKFNKKKGEEVIKIVFGKRIL